jgi:hypothetical protein
MTFWFTFAVFLFISIYFTFYISKIDEIVIIEDLRSWYFSLSFCSIMKSHMWSKTTRGLFICHCGSLISSLVLFNTSLTIVAFLAKSWSLSLQEAYEMMSCSAWTFIGNIHTSCKHVLILSFYLVDVVQGCKDFLVILCLQCKILLLESMRVPCFA